MGTTMTRATGTNTRFLDGLPVDLDLSHVLERDVVSALLHVHVASYLTVHVIMYCLHSLYPLPCTVLYNELFPHANLHPSLEHEPVSITAGAVASEASHPAMLLHSITCTC